MTIALALATPSLAFATPARTRVSEAARAPAGEVVRAPATPAAASATEVSSYAARERQDHAVTRYEGGNVIVIGISGTALLVVLLVLILI